MCAAAGSKRIVFAEDYKSWWQAFRGQTVGKNKKPVKKKITFVRRKKKKHENLRMPTTTCILYTRYGILLFHFHFFPYDRPASIANCSDLLMQHARSRAPGRSSSAIFIVVHPATVTLSYVQCVSFDRRPPDDRRTRRFRRNAPSNDRCVRRLLHDDAGPFVRCVRTANVGHWMRGTAPGSSKGAVP